MVIEELTKYSMLLINKKIWYVYDLMPNRKDSVLLISRDEKFILLDMSNSNVINIDNISIDTNPEYFL